jgi:hypothetical protein
MGLELRSVWSVFERLLPFNEVLAVLSTTPLRAPLTGLQSEPSGCLSGLVFDIPRRQMRINVDLLVVMSIERSEQESGTTAPQRPLRSHFKDNSVS